MTERNEARLSVPLAIALSAGSALLMAGISWGMYSQSIDSLQREQREQSTLVRAHETKIAVLEAKLDTIISQLREANGRLARLEQNP